MATAPQAFVRRVKDRVKNERRETPFTLRTIDEDENGEEIIVREDTYLAVEPSEEQLLAAFAEGGREDATLADQTAAIFDLFRAALPESDFRRLYKRFKDPEDLDVDFEALNDIFEWLLETWADFPTQSPAASSRSRATAGTRSTGRAPGKGSTR